jgi:hypothetical protein
MTTEGAERRAGHPAPRRRRWSKKALRLMAWVAGGASFAAPWGALALAPKPVAASQAPLPRQVIIRRIIRHVYIQAPAQKAPKVRYVFVGGGSSGSGGGGSPAPTSSGGSHP